MRKASVVVTLFAFTLSVSEAALLINQNGTISGLSGNIVNYTFSSGWSYITGGSSGTGHEIAQSTGSVGGVDGTISFSGLNAGEEVRLTVLPTISGNTTGGPYSWNGASASAVPVEFDVTTGSGTWDISNVVQSLFTNQVTTTAGSVSGGDELISYGADWGNIILTATADISGDVVISYSSPNSGTAVDAYAFDAVVIPEPSSIFCLVLSSICFLVRRKRTH